MAHMVRLSGEEVKTLMAYPVRTVTRPSTLAGQANGRIAPDRLRSVTTKGGTATLVGPAAAAWVALCAAAEAAGHVLVPFSTYRSYEAQRTLFLARYRTSPKANTDVKTWNGQTWYRHTGATTAAPGTSNHGWGLAVDVRVMRGGKAHPIDAPALAWLLAGNALRHGWSWEIQSEPWHIRYFAGDNTPEDTMTPDQERRLLDAIDGLRSQLHRITDTGLRDSRPRNERATLEARMEKVYRSTQSMSAALARLAEQRTDGVNVAALAAEIADALDDDLAAAVANELGRRLGPR